MSKFRFTKYHLGGLIVTLLACGYLTKAVIQSTQLRPLAVILPLACYVLAVVNAWSLQQMVYANDRKIQLGFAAVFVLCMFAWLGMVPLVLIVAYASLGGHVDFS